MYRDSGDMNRYYERRYFRAVHIFAQVIHDTDYILNYTVYIYIVHIKCNFVWKTRRYPEDNLIKFKKKRKKSVAYVTT